MASNELSRDHCQEGAQQPAAEPAGPAEQPAARRWRARVPNSHLGRIAGRDKASVYGIQLLFWREYRRRSKPEFVLSLAEAMKPPEKGGLGMSERAFTAGIKILVESGVLTRWQPNHRAPAQEKLAPAIKGEGYVALDPEFILYAPAKLVAFVAMVLLSPKPVHAKHVARGYLDIRHHKTVNALVERALAEGRIAGAKVGGRWVVCRPEKAAELVKNGGAKPGPEPAEPVKTGDTKPVKNGDAYRELDDSSGTANGTATSSAVASQESLGSNLALRAPAACSNPSDLDDAAAAADLRLTSDDDAVVLRRADMAGALALHLLLTPGGLHGYRVLLAEHGERASSRAR